MKASELISQVPASFDKAVASGDLLFFPSTVHKHVESGVEFEIRLCPALQKKPVLPTPNFAPDQNADTMVQVEKGKEPKKFDPFAPPYVPNLYLGELIREEGDGEYVALLNKYSVVPQHFLLVTKEFKSQTAPLLPPDLVQAYTLLLAARKAHKPFFAFYNCGDNSGASQAHKHIQFLPVEDDGPPIEQLARNVKLETPDKPFSLNALPYANHVVRFPNLSSSTPPEQLEQVLANSFFALLDLVISTVRHDPDYPAGMPSYNVILTLEHLHLIPRRHETYTLQETGESLSVNSLGFAGMLLVKSEEELEAVKKESVGKILRGVGLQNVHELQVVGETEGDE